MEISRRTSLGIMGTSAVWLSDLSNAMGAASDPFLTTNTYPWSTFAKRRGESLTLHTDELFSAIVSTGIVGYEPIINHSEEFDGLAGRLKKHGLEMRSLYVNSTLHDEALAGESIADVLSIGRRAVETGTKIVVTNPSPIRWGGDEDKSDQQLRCQAEMLNQLGAGLSELGIMLAYHNHDAELRHGGREFHHMLTATDPANVKFCLDAHWVFRGCGDSEVAVFDALAHYADRVVELHLRQSTNGIWNEAFSMTGDINYQRIIAGLADRGIVPHLVLEQAVESKSPDSMTVTEAHRASREVFNP